MPSPGSLSLQIENEVTYTSEAKHLVGVFGGGSGWQWDRRLLSVNGFLATDWESKLEVETDALLEGTQLTDWQSGILSGVDLYDILKWKFQDSLYWTPRYETGTFAVHWDARKLYSDWSYSINVDSTNVNGDSLTYIDLDSNIYWDSISARIYTRDSKGQRLTFRNWDFVEEFTAPIVAGSRDNSQISDRHWEMKVSSDDLIFNQTPTEVVGQIVTGGLTQSVIEASWESLGAGDADGKFSYLKYFPIERGSSLKVVKIDSGGTVTELTKVDRLWDSSVTDEHVAINYDLGILEFGGYRAPDLVLAEDINDTITEIPVLMGQDDFNSWPDGGVFTIGSESIRYTGKGHRKFLNCERGHLSTTPAAHNKYDVLDHITGGAGIADTFNLWVAYTAVPRVDYEITTYDLRTANRGWLNVHPLVNPKSNKIVQVESQDINIASIVLEADIPLIGGSLYGPVYYGTQTVPMTATAYNSGGQPVDDVDITISVIDGLGTINAVTNYTATTNTSGEIYGLYNTPYSLDSVELEAIPTHSGADTIFAVADLKGVPNLNDVWIYQVLKNDPIEGTVGREVNAQSFTAGTLHYNEVATFEINMPHTDEYGRPPSMPIENYDVASDEFSQIVVYGTDATIRRYNILWSTPGPNTAAESMTFGVDSNTNPLLGAGAVVWILGPKDTEYVSGTGTRVILYKWFTGGEYQHPVTDAAASVSAPVAAPLRPSSLSGTDITVSGYNLPIGSETDRRENLAGYTVIAPGKVQIQATATDPYTGNTITSNLVSFTLKLPNQLVGVDTIT